MFEEMTEQQAREEILKLTREYCEKYHNQKKPPHFLYSYKPFAGK